ncbi:MAG: transposase, partial [Burkholderiales bacterium]|nr:transposase [Burkholderiales bacterium]
MYPNDNFRFFHRDLWEAHYGKESGKPFEMHVGLYALCLSIGHATGIYPLLYDCFGPMFANAIMDYAFYNIKTNSCVTQHFAQSMRDDFLFSRSRLGQNWYGNFFADPVNADSIAQFKSKWLKKIAAEDNTDAWLCIDGSNNDSSVTGGELAELGHAKSGHAMTVIGYQWAVRASDGMPVSWTVNEGSMVDSKAIDEMVRYLAAGGLKVAGIILDRGFCTKEVYRLVVSKGFALVAMLKKDICGFKEMMRLHGAEIHAKIEHRIGIHGIFATTGNVKLFEDSE